jgi:hypothetical protein
MGVLILSVLQNLEVPNFSNDSIASAPISDEFNFSIYWCFEGCKISGFHDLTTILGRVRALFSHGSAQING